ncbi:MAG: fenitrothion hydrolase [Actinomycetota bacterium]|nr:fenitrothion hydrolase [Actinomycetota bacterium]
MSRRLRRRPLAGALTALALLAAAVSPDLASAHGLVGKQDLPIPRWLFAWAASLVLVVSFAGLAVLWPKPRLESLRERRVLRFPRFVDPLLGLLGVAFFVLFVYAGFAGAQTATDNLVPTVVYVLFWVGIAFASALFGDIFRAVNPWRAVARFVSWLTGLLWRGATPEPLPYPPRLGRWPAALGILAFAWVELSYANKDDPSILATMALAYTVVQLFGMSLYGIEPWERHGDAFAVYFGLFARISPLRWERGTLYVRPPLCRVPRLDTVPGTLPLLCVMIGTTSFDGFSQGQAWNAIVPHLQSGFTDLGLTAEGPLEASFTIGLVGMVLLVAALYRAGIAGMPSVDRDDTSRDLARLFAHTLLPISLAYVVAHYFSLLAYQGQATAYLVSDPLGNGNDIFGTAASSINYNVIGPNGIWYVQVVALLAGHISGLILAHDRALTVYSDARDATRSQYWMLTVMVAFTSLGLWLLSAAAQ